MLHGSPISARLPEDLGFGERFWYWHGASGRSYIHSIYLASACPPLPGAVYVVVRRTAEGRRPVAVGRFPSVIDRLTGDVSEAYAGIDPNDEVHVHLLARDEASARAVQSDLGCALVDVEQVRCATGGFAERGQLELVMS